MLQGKTFIMTGRVIYRLQRRRGCEPNSNLHATFQNIQYTIFL